MFEIKKIIIIIIIQGLLCTQACLRSINDNYFQSDLPMIPIFRSSEVVPPEAIIAERLNKFDDQFTNWYYLICPSF